MSPLDVLSLVVGALQLLLAGVVARQLGRFGRAYPWLGALTAFFALRGVTRIYAAAAGHTPETLALPVDVLLILVLVLLIAGVERTARALKLAEDEALYRAEEYSRALADYRRLARHRLANPLTAIRGGVTALKDLPALSEDRRLALLDAIEAESRRLEEVVLDPDTLAPEERALRPWPEVPPGP